MTMGNLEKGITRVGEGYRGRSWNILGQLYLPKASCDTTFAFETNSDPGQHVPVHVHPSQDEFILVLKGELDLKLDGVWSKARGRRSRPHATQCTARLFNKSDAPARALFWISPSAPARLERRDTDIWHQRTGGPSACSVRVEKRCVGTVSSGELRGGGPLWRACEPRLLPCPPGSPREPWPTWTHSGSP